MRLEETYLPFTVEEFKEHFVEIGNNREKHIKYYINSINNYKEFNPLTTPKDQWSKLRQIEKDERFWTASSLMTFFHNNTNRYNQLKEILINAFGENPPLDNINSWDECLNENLKLYFEPNIPSSKEYLEWLKINVENRNFIPYILEKAKNKNNVEYRTDLEGPTNVDALLINSKNGFSVFIEAKVLSDISYQVSYDSMRNQIIRNIDVMLSDKNENLNEPLNKREPEKSLFLLLTPKLYIDNPKTRLYGYKYNEYKNNPLSLSEELPHKRNNLEYWIKISKRLGWITWENLKEINRDCCKWLD